ncbi:MAG: hypothetical protein ACTSYK_04560 [Alphaproteobacteria bacterium]
MMFHRRAVYGFSAVFGLALAVFAGTSDEARAQEFVYRGNAATGPTVVQYLKQVGSEGKEVPHGQLKIDGRPVNCGKRPTVLNPNFDSWGGAFPGFLILNTRKIEGLSTQVKLYIYSHECGHQFIGADETKADLFAIRRGVKWGWLDAQGLEEICIFISKLKGDAVHPPGPQRCKTMRGYYRRLVTSEDQQQASSGSDWRPKMLGPSN